MRVTVVDYGLGNIFSVRAALDSIGFEATVDTDGTAIAIADVVVVPGVAAFAAGIANLEERGQRTALESAFAREQRLVGLCLGAQMFLEASAEAPGIAGLGFLKGSVSELRSRHGGVTNQGWSMVSFLDTETSTSLQVLQGKYMYFSHSYAMELDMRVAATASIKLGESRVLAAYESAGLRGVQFHPERSGPDGLRVLRALISEQPRA